MGLALRCFAETMSYCFAALCVMSVMKASLISILVDHVCCCVLLLLRRVKLLCHVKH